ncbi:hypothetical protein F5888DRAFT_1125136 [Russula emetica]|nr:hypothetical protein F5888DRAFT_1125136 [Russula emetica]
MRQGAGGVSSCRVTMETKNSRTHRSSLTVCNSEKRQYSFFLLDRKIRNLSWWPRHFNHFKLGNEPSHTDMRVKDIQKRVKKRRFGNFKGFATLRHVSAPLCFSPTHQFAFAGYLGRFDRDQRQGAGVIIIITHIINGTMRSNGRTSLSLLFSSTKNHERRAPLSSHAIYLSRSSSPSISTAHVSVYHRQCRFSPKSLRVIDSTDL